MTATSTAIDSDKKGTEPLQRILDWGIMNNAILRQGTIAVRDPATGMAKEGVTELGAIALGFVGRNENASVDGIYDNTGGADDAFRVRIEPRTKKLQNSGADPITQAMRGLDCYIVDNQTVAATNGGGTRSVAGKVILVESDGVYVEIGLAHAVPTLAGQGIQSGTGTLIGGQLNLAAGITITANSRIFAFRKTKAGTPGIMYDAPAANRTPGAPGTGAFRIQSYTDSGATLAAADTSTIDWLIIG